MTDAQGGEGPTDRIRGEPVRRAWMVAAAVLATTRVAHLLVAYLATHLLDPGPSGGERGLLDTWENWDAGHFLAIAQNGYEGEGTDPFATAFFPAFPLTLRAGAAVGLPHVGVGLLVSAIACLVAFAYLFRLAESDLGEGAGTDAVLLLALFPTSVFLVAPYSEALFLAGAIPAFFLARRGRWLAASLPLALATATRAAGLFLLVGLAAEFVRARRFDRRSVTHAAVALGAGLLPPVAYAVFLRTTRGSAFDFLTSQRLGWARSFAPPWEALTNTLANASDPATSSNFSLAWKLEIVAAVAGLAGLAWTVSRREWGYAAYTGTTMAALLTSTYYLSIPRILLTLFPLVLMITSQVRRRPLLRDCVLVAFAACAFVGTVVFTQERWFF